MTKKMKYSAGQLFVMLAIDAAALEIGALVLEYCINKDNPNIKVDEYEGWYPLGIIANDLDIKPILESYEAMAGSPSNLMGDALTGKKVEIDVSIMAPRPMARALSNTNKLITYVEPTTPIQTTVDLTTATAFAPTHTTIRVADVTGFEVGQKVVMVTGNTTYETHEEPLEISFIDTTGKILHFKTPYFQFPEHGADVYVITGEDYEMSGAVLPNGRFRISKYNNGNESLGLYDLKNCVVHSTNKKLGQKNPSEVSLKFKVLPIPTVTVVSGESPQVTYKHFTESIRY